MASIHELLEPARAKGNEPAILKPNARVIVAGDPPQAACTAYLTTDGAVEIVLGGGDLRHARAIYAHVEAMARDEGAGVIRIIGRPGWARLFGMVCVGTDGECWIMEKAVMT